MHIMRAQLGFGRWLVLALAVPCRLFAAGSLPTTLAFSPSVATPRGGRSIISRLEASTSSSADVVASTLSPSHQPKNSFISPTFSVYIEDTDSYGVIYNSNYLRCYERALSHVPRKHGSDNGRWILSLINNQKFRSSPALGEEYLIRGELIERSSEDGMMKDDGVEEWQLEMVTRNNKDKSPGGGKNEDDWIVHNSATATMRLTKTKKEEATALATMPLTIQSSDNINLGKMIEYSFTPYHDEFDMHLHHYGNPQQSYHIPLRSAMNFFERSRTSYLGGPEALRRMQVEDDILWVVTSVDDGELVLDSITLEHPIDGKVDQHEEEEDRVISLEGTHEWHPHPGKEVTVQTNFVTKRRGMIVECQHRLFMDVVGKASDNERFGINNNRRLLAQATVTVMALKGSNRRPTSKLPQWILDLIM